MQNQNNDLSNSDHLFLQGNNNNTEIYNSLSISRLIPIKNKNDSGFSSFISQRNPSILSSSPIVAQGINNSRIDSPGTSYSSRNSAIFNDEELEDVFFNHSQFLPIERSTEKSKDCNFNHLRDLDLNSEGCNVRHSLRNSPWTVRTESGALNEEDEDSDKEASNYSIEPVSMTGLPELIQCCTLQCNRGLDESVTLSDERKELIASKLIEIADKLNNNSKVRTRNPSASSDITKSSSKRQSHSSFADIMPCSCGSVVDLIISLFNVYQVHKGMSTSSVVVSSQSMANMTRPGSTVRKRTRSYTQ